VWSATRRFSTNPSDEKEFLPLLNFSFGGKAEIPTYSLACTKRRRNQLRT